MVNKEDEQWNKLQVWQDKNSDGISQAEELFQLEELGIQQLNLNHQSNIVSENGNIITKTGSYVTEDKMVHSMAEASFALNTMDAYEKETIEITGDIEDLPDLRGSGQMGSLHQAMAKNEELKNLLQKRKVELSKNKK